MNSADQAVDHLIPPADWLDDPDNHEVPGFAWFLLLAALLAALLRLYRLDGQSLWVDEIQTWRQIRPAAGLVFWRQILDAIQGPLYPAVLWPVVRWQPDAFWMRLPAAVAGVLTVPVLGLFGARLFDQRTGLLAALFLAVNPFHVWYSQEARGYSLLMFFVVTAGLCVLRLSRGKGNAGHAVWLGICGALAMGSNLSAAFFWLALGVIPLYSFLRGNRKDAGLWLLGLGTGVVLMLPWFLQAAGIWEVGRILPGAATGEALRGDSTFSFLAVPYTIFSFFCGYSCGPSLAELHRLSGHAVLAGYWPILAGVALVMAFPLWHAFRSLRGEQWMLLVWAAVPFVVLMVLAQRNIKPWNPRYLSAVLPWFLVLLAAGTVRMPGRWRVVSALLITGMMLWSLGNDFWNPRYAKEDVRAAAEFLSRNNPEGEPVLVPVVTAVFDFYYEGSGTLLDTYHVPPLDGPEAASQFMSTRMQGLDAAWIVCARYWEFDPEDFLPAVLSHAGTLLLEFKAPGVKVYHWQRRGAES